jgi:hypothetical protein
VGGDVFDGAFLPGAWPLAALEIDTGSTSATRIQMTLLSCGGENLTHVSSASSSPRHAPDGVKRPPIE